MAGVDSRDEAVPDPDAVAAPAPTLALGTRGDFATLGAFFGLVLGARTTFGLGTGATYVPFAFFSASSASFLALRSASCLSFFSRLSTFADMISLIPCGLPWRSFICARQ